jgi:hypothetical protein
MKHFLQVISDCKADILAAADILSSISHKVNSKISMVPLTDIYAQVENLNKVGRIKG